MKKKELVHTEYLKWKTIHGIYGKRKRLKRWATLFTLYIHYCLLRRKESFFWYVNLYDEQENQKKRLNKLIDQKMDVSIAKLNDIQSKQTILNDQLNRRVCATDQKLTCIENKIEQVVTKTVVKERKKQYTDKVVNVGTIDVFLCQYQNYQYCSYDLVTRYIAIKDRNDNGSDLLGSLYSKMQIKSCGLSWDERFCALIDSVAKNGIYKDTYITVNENMIITDGAHRLMLSMNEGLDVISVKMVNKEFTRPWTYSWFWEKGFSPDDCYRIKKVWHDIVESFRYPFYVVIFSPAVDYFQQITEDLKQYDPQNISIVTVDDYIFSEWQLKGLIKGMYHEDVISDMDLEKKIENIIGTSHVNDNNYPIRVVKVNVEMPRFVIRKENGFPQSMTLKEMKVALRGRYRDYISNYKYDVIMHSSDNYIQSKMMKKLFEIDSNIMDLFEKISSWRYAVVKLEESKQANDFPARFFINSEIDILVEDADMKQLTDIIENYFMEKYNDEFSVLVHHSNRSVIITLSYSSFDVFTVHLQTAEYFGMNPSINQYFLDNRVEIRKIYELERKSEILIRLSEIVKKPEKYWHANYIRKYSLYIDESKIEQAFIEGSKLKSDVIQYIDSLSGYRRYVKGEID